jgi:hypothetical protein
MVKGLKDVERVSDNLSKTIKWCGSMYSYLDESVILLKKMLATTDSKTADNLYKKIHYQLRYATNSQRRGINRYYPKVKSGLKDLEEILPDNLKTDLGNIIRLIRPNEAVLIRETSFYVGELKSDFLNLKLQLGLLKKDPDRLASVQALIKKLIAEINTTIAKGAGQFGLVPFAAVLEKQLKPFINKLKKLSA